jgi:MFS family permease
MLGTFVVMLGFGILSPVLPNYARSFGVGYDSIGLLISAFSFARLVADPFVGRYIDRYGERRMVVLGAVWVGVSSIASALAPTFTLLVVLRGLGGVGSALFFAALLSFLLRTIPAERTGRVMSVFYAAFNIGFIAGGPLGGVIAIVSGLASPLYIYVASLPSALLFRRDLRSRASRGRGAARACAAPLGTAARDGARRNLAYLWTIGAVFQTLIPLFGHDEVGLTLGGVGLALAVATATELVSLYPAGSATDRRGRRAVLIPSLAGLAAVVATLGLASPPVVFMVAMGALGVASGYSGVPPAPMLSDVTPDELKGSAVAVFRFAGDLGFVLGPLVAGTAANAVGFGGAFAISAVPALVALALVLSIAETKKILPKTDEAPGF